MKYLDPQFTDHIALPDAMKLEFILAGKNQEAPEGTMECVCVHTPCRKQACGLCFSAEEDFLLSQAALLEQISSMQPLLDSSYVRGQS